jgi:glycine/D-amino acid oxidase-like deaminating enzyme
MALVAPRSLWDADLSATERVQIHPPPGDLEVDVAIIGAGFSGMWTAWALKTHDPSLRIAILERNSALVNLPWVGHRSRRWEPEPLRWFGVNATRSMAKVSDRLDEKRLP